MLSGTNYRSCQNTTKSGKTCQKWTVNTPHTHTFTIGQHENLGIGDHNYCRSPDEDNRVWCYTTDPDTRWEYCDAVNNVSSSSGNTYKINFDNKTKSISEYLKEFKRF